MTLRPKLLVTQSSCVATLDYLKLESPPVSSAVALQASRNGYAKGYGFWFDSELADGILMSTAPGHARAEYAAGVYPNVAAAWLEPVRIGAGDEIKASLRFTAVNDDYVWQWNTRIETADSRQTKAEFQQSNFNGRFVSAADLHKRALTHRPR